MRWTERASGVAEGHIEKTAEILKTKAAEILVTENDGKVHHF